MKKFNILAHTALGAAIAALVGSAGIANATEPCGDFGECKVLVEINSTDGDVGFHFLMDGDDLRYGALFNPKKRKIYSYGARREMAKQFVTETFNESAEPLCWHPEPEDDEYGEDVVTLEEFIDRWYDGTYRFFGIGAGWDLSFGESELTFDLPAAPTELDWVVEEDEHEPGEYEYEITWEAGDDLGECADRDEVLELLAEGILPSDPYDEVTVAAWEVVLEPDVDDGDPLGAMKYVVRIPGDADEFEVEVPDDYLEALGEENVPAKIEIGAIGAGENATFTEIDEICLNDTNPAGSLAPDPEDPEEEILLNGCEFEVEEEDGED